ncbi:MAG: hypothetical protein C0631_16920 [Sedimenticola sp.]|nr:MAG: hypothetical protein C0631_16920 [Sedimenticola sp.]
MAKLEQLNIQYQPGEDRLALRIRFGDDSEINLWLTRRYSKLLLSVLDSITHGGQPAEGAVSRQAQKAINEFQREAATSNADFSTEYKENASSHPLGKELVLVTRIQYTRLKEEMIKLTLGTDTDKNINLNLSQKLLHTLAKLIQVGAEKAEWALDAPGESPQKPGGKAAPKPLH